MAIEKGCASASSRRRPDCGSSAAMMGTVMLPSTARSPRDRASCRNREIVLRGL